jgi:hypothetical protein
MLFRTASLRARTRALGLATVTTLAAAAAFGTASAGADTLPNSSTVNLSPYSIPNSAPAYTPGGDTIPSITGTMGNAAQLFMGGDYANTSQALGVENGSGAWGTPATTSAATDSTNQQWYFQKVGWVQTHADQNVDSNAFTYQMPVFRIINYNNGSHTCLDAEGGGGAQYTPVDSYGCDPNQNLQTNQLWVADFAPASSQGTSSTTGSTISGVDDDPSFNSPTLQFNDGVGLIASVASLAADGFDLSQTPVLSAAVDHVSGDNSTTQLIEPGTWPASVTNSTFLPVDAHVPSTTPPAPNPPSCTKFMCLINIGDEG